MPAKPANQAPLAITLAATDTSSPSAAPTSTGGQTVEGALWVLLLIVAAATRLWDLGGQPLAAGEAARALSSWQMLHQQGGLADAPLLVYGNALIFFAFGANDAAARLLPALAGIALAALPYLARQELGRWGALTAGTLIILSPNLLHASRLVGAQSLTAAAGLASVIFLIRLMEGPKGRWLTLSAIALSLLILNGADAYTLLLVLAAAGLWLAFKGKLPQLEGAGLRRAGLLAGAIIALGTTGLLFNLHGVQEGLVDPFARWLDGWRGAGAPWHLPLQTLLIYEAPIALFGAIGAAKALRRGDGTARLLVLWAAVALAVSVGARDRGTAGSPLTVIPVALLAGPVVAGLVHRALKLVPRTELVAHLAVSLCLLSLFWIATLFFTMPDQVLPASVPLGPLVLPLRSAGGTALQAQIVFLLAVVIGFTLWLAPRYMTELLGLLGVVVLVLVSLHAAVLLAYAPNASPAELVVGSRTSIDVRTLARDIGAAVDSLAIGNRPNGVRLSLADEALLVWYLREIPSLRLGARPEQNDGLIVADAAGPPPAGRFGTQRYRLRSAWLDEYTSLRSFWRWLLLREPPAPLRSQDVVLYMKLQ